jgi:hypothetical protein
MFSNYQWYTKISNLTLVKTYGVVSFNILPFLRRLVVNYTCGLTPYIANHIELLVSSSPIMVFEKKGIFLFTMHNVQCVSYEKVLYMSQHPTPTLPIFINQNWSNSRCIDLKAFPNIWKRRYKPSYTINNITNLLLNHD